MSDLFPTLVEAINLGRTVSFEYDDKPRVVEVHAVGFSSKDGAPVMRGYQVAGEASRPLPHWSMFRLDKVDALTLAAVPLSEAPRPGYAMNDTHMSRIVAQIELSEKEAA